MLLKLFVQAGKASLVQSAAAPTQSVIVGKHIDGVSSTNNSLCDNAKAESREQKFDADMLQRNAAGAGADTLKALALGLANVIGGLIILGHNVRVFFCRISIASFLVCGIVPAVVYGFSFRKSDDKVLKLAVMAGASLVCIILLALGKAHVRKPQRRYFRTVLYYVCLGILASGISYLVGELMKKLAEQVGLFESISAARVPLLDQNTIGGGTAAY
ncbi:hypothetical protein V6N12_037635 [Hibiscus sabdariffa]|uniref:Vacuolar iron transporter n=1 Tax=Hibiscus sabdariffa TaxID=183260 RepID=A0ABR2C1H1_9ROSI